MSNESNAIGMNVVDDEFEKWWESDGQYCRAGGGSYEKTFAYRAYEAAISLANTHFSSTLTDDQSTGYTAVDMATAAAQGFRDGAASVVVELPKRVVDWSTDNWASGYNLALEHSKAAIIVAGGSVKDGN